MIGTKFYEVVRNVGEDVGTARGRFRENLYNNYSKQEYLFNKIINLSDKDPSLIAYHAEGCSIAVSKFDSAASAVIISGEDERVPNAKSLLEEIAEAELEEVSPVLLREISLN